MLYVAESATPLTTSPSVAARVNDSVCNSTIDLSPGLASAGGSLTSLIVIVVVCSLNAPCGSVARKTTACWPSCDSVGVQLNDPELESKTMLGRLPLTIE